MTFFLLQITSKLSKKDNKTFRLILASSVGGLYSFIILFDELPIAITLLSKIIIAFVIVGIAFKFYRLSSYLTTTLIFFFSSFVVLGVVVAIYFITNNDLIAINNSVVYFDISARGLLISAFFAYCLSCIIVRLYNKKLAKDEMYSLEITNNNKTVKLFAFVDTGNKLREPFSNAPVIVVDSSKLNDFVGDSKIRLIPTTTVNGDALLTAFKPEKLVVKSSGRREIIDNAYIALSNDVKSEQFSAIINPEILSL